MPKQKTTRRADGLLVKTVKDPRTGKRVYFYGRTEREISKKMLLFTESISAGRTFAEVADEWWGDAMERIAFQTAKSYKPALRRAADEFGDKAIKDIKPLDINRFLHSLKRTLSTKTISHNRLVLNLIFNHAIMAGDIETNPCAAIRLPSGERNIRSAASPEDEAKVKASADVWLFPYFAIMSGMRKGEILALQWKDIHFDESYIDVTKSVEHIGDRPRIKKPKTAAGVRVVPLLDPLKEKLLAIKDRRADGYIFSDTNGDTPLTDSRYATLYKHFQADTGVTCTAHQLRHSFATVAFECGIPVKSVQEILGHKQLSTTMDIYTEFRKKSILATAHLLNEKMG